MEKPQLLVSGLQVTDQNEIPSLYQAQTKEFTYINRILQEPLREDSHSLSLSLFFLLVHTTDPRSHNRYEDDSSTLKVPILDLKWQRGLLRGD